MTCDDVRARLPLFVTADLPAGEAAGVRAHLVGCPGCRADWAGLARVRALLDAAPAPPVPPPDVPAIYAAALARHARTARRWRRAATAAGALAAGLLVAAVVPKLEVRAGPGAVVVRWGPAAPAPPPAGPDPRLVARLAELDARVRGHEKLEADLGSLRELLLTLAADVDARDRRQRDALTAAVGRLGAFEAEARDQFRQTEQATAVLVTALTDKPRPDPEGGKP